MKIRYILPLFLAIILSSCTKEIVIKELSITVSKNKILNDNKDAFLVLAKDQDNNDVSEHVVFVFNGIAQASNIISSDLVGTADLQAEFEDIRSNSIEIEVLEDIGFEYEKVILIEQFTATWCPWCPRAISQINILSALDRNTSHIAYHLNDELAFSLTPDLMEYFGSTSIPAIWADRILSWAGDIYDIEFMHKAVRAGIGLEVSELSSESLSVDVSVNFGKLYSDDINLSVYLLEDSLIVAQKSNYNNDSNSQWYQRGTLIQDFAHANVMLATLTNFFGDKIPSDNIDIGSLYEKTFTLAVSETASAGTVKINRAANLKVVAFLSYGSGTRKGEVINSIICNVGSISQNNLDE